MGAIELVPASALRPALYNPREADEERLALVRLSLQKLGFLLPLVATPDGEILSGHQRHAVAVAMGAKRLPVMRVDVKESARRGVNLLFNRATNDITIEATEQDLRTAIRAANVEALASLLPDIQPDSPDFWPCMSATERPVLPLARQNIKGFVRHAANVGRMLARLHIHLPIVATPDGTVINGMGRLEAAARKGRKIISVVEIEKKKADFARAMLNLLSMDFRFTGDNTDFLRYCSFRRAWLRRTHLGRAFILPVYSHKRLADVKLDDRFMGKWRQACGDSVLDFGSGQGDEARMLRAKGVRVAEFEPYPAENGIVNRKKGRASALRFLADVRAGVKFSAIFVSSVLNSVPFPEDREYILRIVAALCGPETVVCLAARSTKGSAWCWHVNGEALSNRASRGCQFKLAMEPGVHIGDIANAPKIQKFYAPEEWKELLERFFGEVRSGHSDGMMTAVCRKALNFRPQDLARSLRFEFNLPYPDGKRLGLAPQALAAFSHRLGVSLEPN